MSRIRWTTTCMRPLVRKWEPAQSMSCLATWNSRSLDYLMAKVAAPAPAITCTFQSVRRKESGDKGMLSSCKDAFQKCQTSFLLPSCWLELRHISSTPGSFERWKIQSFFFSPPGKSYAWLQNGVSIITQEGGMDAFENSQQCLTHSPCSISVKAHIFMLHIKWSLILFCAQIHPRACQQTPKLQTTLDQNLKLSPGAT